ncbi:MAG: hypothetical protein JXB48_05910 [Candidatus Latescibacteria bacterium]|nr:hypothetical protein [Candidatus Latescibacterota bacterium]
MGNVMFEVGFCFAGVLIYFAIGSYYRTLYGLALAVVSLFLYLTGLMLEMNVIIRFLLQIAPCALITYKQSSGNITLVKDKKMCPVCGYLNEPDAKICKALHCEADLSEYEDTSKLGYYLPPKLIAGLLIFVIGGSLLYEYISAGKFILAVIYGA